MPLLINALFLLPMVDLVLLALRHLDCASSPKSKLRTGHALCCAAALAAAACFAVVPVDALLKLI